MQRVLLAFVLIATSLAVGPSADAGAPAVVITSITPGQVKTNPDYSASFRGHFWDFEDETHFSIEETLGWEDVSVSGGWFTGTSTQIDPRLRLNNATIPTTNPEPSEYFGRPFDPAYDRLAVRMCSDTPTKVLARWLRDGSYAGSDWGETKQRSIGAGCRIIEFDLVDDRNFNTGGLGWEEGGMTSIELRPVDNTGITINVDSVSLTKKPRGKKITINWNSSDTVGFYLARNANGSDSTRYWGNRSGGSMTANLPSLEPGTWHVGLVVGGDEQPPSGSFIINAPPVGTLHSPSFTSGPEYATLVRGDAWDMNESSDVIWPANLTDMTFSGGIFEAVNDLSAQGNDPRFLLPLAGNIDPTVYRYFTYRMWVEGEGVLQGTGGVARVLFGVDDGEDEWTVSEDIRVYKGWRTVTLDLAEMVIDKDFAGEWGDAPVDRLRLDPHESSDERRIEVDWITLTAMDSGAGRYDITFTATDAENNPIIARYFFGTDTDVKTRTRAKCRKSSGPDECRWRSGIVPDGVYYVYLRLKDSRGNVSWVISEAPVNIVH